MATQWGFDGGRLVLSYPLNDTESGALWFEPATVAAEADGQSRLMKSSASGIRTCNRKFTPRAATRQARRPGRVLYVQTPDGVYLNAAGVTGLEDGTPMQTDDILEIGSNTKSMTVVLLMQLVEQGLISLDDPLSQWLPEQAAAVFNGDQITIRQMAHPRPASGTTPMTSLVMGPATRTPWSQRTRPRKWFSLRPTTARPTSPPAEEGQWFYSNTGYVLLGMIIEQITGQAIGELMQSRIFDPLGMETAVFLEGVPEPGQITTQGYFWPGDGERVNTTNWNASQGWAAGAAAMTAADLRMARRWRPASCSRMRTP